MCLFARWQAPNSDVDENVVMLNFAMVQTAIASIQSRDAFPANLKTRVGLESGRAPMKNVRELLYRKCTPSLANEITFIAFCLEVSDRACFAVIACD